MEPARRKTGARKVGIVLVCAASAVVVLWLLWPRDHLLTERAHSVVQVKPQEHWCWLTNDQLTITTLEREGRWDEPDTWLGHIDLFERSARKRTPLSGLTALLHRPGVSALGPPYRFELSPNHTWLVWNNYRTADGYAFPAAAHLDGTQYREWGRDKVEVNGFLDDRHYVQQTGDEAFSVKVRDLQDPRKDKQYPRSAPEAKPLVASQTAQRPYYIWMNRSQRGQAASVDMDVYRAKDALPVMFAYRYPKRRPPVPLYKNTVPLPKDGSLSDWSLSPQRDRVVYHVQIVRENPVLVQLKRLFPSLVVEPVVTEALYIGRIDEPRMYEIGHVPFPAEQYADAKYIGWDTERSKEELEDIQWLPDGRQISFIYHGILYTMPAESGK